MRHKSFFSWHTLQWVGENTQTIWDPVFHFTTYFSTHTQACFPTVSLFHFKAVHLSFPNTMGVSQSTCLRVAMEAISWFRNQPFSAFKEDAVAALVRLWSSSPWTNGKEARSPGWKKATEQTADLEDDYQHQYYSESIWKRLWVSPWESKQEECGTQRGLRWLSGGPRY